MKTQNIIAICWLLVLTTSVHAYDLDSIYDVLDREIALADKYVGMKEQHLSSLREQIRRSRTLESKYEMTFQLYEEYSSYDDRMAKRALAECLDLSREMGDAAREATILCFLAYQNSLSGYYSEAIHWLTEISEEGLEGPAVGYFYYASTHAYGELGRYSDDETMSQYYYGLSDRYRDKFFEVADTTSTFFYERQLLYLLSSQQADQAEARCQQWSTTVEPGSHEHAIMAYFRSECCRLRNDEAGRRYWLAVSAVDDCRNAVTNQASLWTLAELVGKDSDLERSNRYIEYSWMCTTKFGGHTRSWQVSPVITTINLLKKNGAAKTLYSTTLSTQSGIEAEFQNGGTIHRSTMAGVGASGGLESIEYGYIIKTTPLIIDANTVNLQPRQGRIHRPFPRPMFALHRQARRLSSEGQSPPQGQPAEGTAANDQQRGTARHRDARTLCQLRCRLPAPLPQLRRRVQHPAPSGVPSAVRSRQRTHHRHAHGRPHPPRHRRLCPHRRIPSPHPKYNI